MSKKLTHDEFIERLKAQNEHFANSEFNIIGEYVKSSTKINCQCCLGHTWSVTPAHLLHDGCGCPYCSGYAIWRGFNDLWTTRPDIAVLLKNTDDGYKLSRCSNKKVEFVCPRCNHIIIQSVDAVFRQGLSCSMCADGVSYPNKFSRALLKQLPLDEVEYEYSPEWARPYRYDNYFKCNGKQYILEMDGAFHFENKDCSDLSLDEVRKIDNIKTTMAIERGIKVIRVDCYYSKFDYIKESILKSELNQLFDLSSIDWQICDEMSCNSFVKNACDLYMSGVCTTSAIGEMLGVTSKAALDYLKRGARVGWCNYTTKDALLHRAKYVQAPIVVVDSNDNIIYEFSCAKVCANEMSKLYGVYMCYECILNACKNNKLYRGFKFRYMNNIQQNN